MTERVEKTDALDPDLLTVNAKPERALFVDMLTRDIELVPAIMDLLDNSVDGARAMPTEGRDGSTDSLTPFWVHLDVNPDRLVIEDNCGGIPLDVARRYAFRFGRPVEYKGVPGSVGQFGVGMKRALFKLGDFFTIDSRAKSTRFEMSVDVKQWEQIDSFQWQFQMSKVDPNYDSTSGGRGTRIEVTQLHESVAEDFRDVTFLSLLTRDTRSRHQQALSEGLSIVINGRRLDSFETKLLSGPDFRPVNRTFTIAAAHSTVTVQIVAGITRPDRAEAGTDDGEAEHFRGGTDAGWWIFCNGRLLVEHDRTRLTGWGDNLPNYHPQYRNFRGYAFLSAATTEDLPWNTTKTGVDEDSRVWRQVQAQIKVAGAEVVSVINRMKVEDRDASNESEMPTVLAARAAALTSATDLETSERFAVPPPPAKPARAVKKPKVKKIQFHVPLDRFDAVAQRLGMSTVAGVGRRVFDYFYEREIEE